MILLLYVVWHLEMLRLTSAVFPRPTFDACTRPRFFYRQPSQCPLLRSGYRSLLEGLKGSTNQMLSAIPLVYSTVNDLQIKLDLYLPSKFDHNARLPAIVCFHGGALTIGDRTAGPLIGSWMIGLFI